MKTILKWIRAYIGQPVWVEVGQLLVKGRRKCDVVTFMGSHGICHANIEKLVTVMPRKTIFER